MRRLFHLSRLQLITALVYKIIYEAFIIYPNLKEIFCNVFVVGRNIFNLKYIVLILIKDTGGRSRKKHEAPPESVYEEVDDSGRGERVPNSVSQHFGSFEGGTSNEELWNAIPERDWKLLAALARKREEETERERLAEQFQKMWLKEKEEREMVEAEISEQYKRYLHQKRSQERSHNEFKRLQRVTEQQLRRGQLMDSIRYKERRSADILAWREDKKIADRIGRSVEEECRIQLAKDKRYKLDIADKWSKEVELVYALKKADDANKRRSEMLKNASQRLAITNALTSWETSLIRQELAASHALKHANTLARVAMKQARSVQLTRARRSREARARHVAAISERMRDAVKRGS